MFLTSLEFLTKAQKVISSSSVEVSDHNLLNPPMILNRLATSEQKMQRLIANSLGIGLNTSVQISMKAVSSLMI